MSRQRRLALYAEKPPDVGDGELFESSLEWRRGVNIVIAFGGLPGLLEIRFVDIIRQRDLGAPTEAGELVPFYFPPDRGVVWVLPEYHRVGASGLPEAEFSVVAAVIALELGDSAVVVRECFAPEEELAPLLAVDANRVLEPRVQLSELINSVFTIHVD